ncbi:MAG: RNA-binding protein, partial [Thermoprotei archaeon]
AFVKDLKIKDIRIGTEQMERPEGGKVNVSTMEIIVSKK